MGIFKDVILSREGYIGRKIVIIIINVVNV